VQTGIVHCLVGQAAGDGAIADDRNAMALLRLIARGQRHP